MPEALFAYHAGEIDTVSMGCSVESTDCSVCGNRAEYPFEYCEHIQQKGREFNGKLAFEVCNGIEFFEESWVYDPADPTAHTQAIDKTAKKTAKGRIQYDDDIVVVTNPDGGIDYKGVYDYNPYREDDWVYDNESETYHLPEYPGYVMEKVAKKTAGCGVCNHDKTARRITIEDDGDVFDFDFTFDTELLEGEIEIYQGDVFYDGNYWPGDSRSYPGYVAAITEIYRDGVYMGEVETDLLDKNCPLDLDDLLIETASPQYVIEYVEDHLEDDLWDDDDLRDRFFMASKTSMVDKTAASSIEVLPDMGCNVCVFGDEDHFSIEIDKNGNGYRSNDYHGIPVSQMPSLLKEYICADLEQFVGTISDDAYGRINSLVDDFIWQCAENQGNPIGDFDELMTYHSTPVAGKEAVNAQDIGRSVEINKNRWHPDLGTKVVTIKEFIMDGDESEYLVLTDDDRYYDGQKVEYIDFDDMEDRFVRYVASVDEDSSYADDPRCPDDADVQKEDQVCPLCGSMTFDGDVCAVCGFQEPPEGFDDIQIEHEEEAEEVEEDAELEEDEMEGADV